MGRYDRLKIYNEQNTFINPSRVYIYKQNGERIDLGLYNSDNKKKLKVYTSEHLWETVTLDKKVTVIPGAKHTSGAFKLKPNNGYCSSTKQVSGETGAAQVCPWYFKTKVRRHTFTTDAIIFRCGNSSDAPGIWIKWLHTGEFELMRAWRATNRKKATTSETFLEPDRIYEISFVIEKDTNNAQIKIVDTVTGTEYTSVHNIFNATNFIINNASNTVGSSEVELLDYIKVQGIQWYNSAKGNIQTKDIDLNTSVPGTTGDYENLNLVQEPDTEIVTWE